MSKTNHQRGFAAEKDPKASEMPYVTFSRGVKLPLSDRAVGATSSAGDATNGKHGIAKGRKGAKKFINSRTRFHENAAVKSLLKKDESEY